MPLYDPAKEVSSLDFGALIGGPMKALVQAQQGAAMTTVEFIRNVGFRAKPTTGADPGGDGDANEPVYVTFSYDKVVPATAPATGDVTSKYSLSVPILTMLPIPSLRIQEATLDFNVKITGSEYTRTESKLNVNASLDFRQSWGSGNVNLKVDVAYQKKDASGGDIQRSYSMGVHVRLVQDEIPAGMDRLLSILENQIKEQPAGTTPRP